MSNNNNNGASLLQRMLDRMLDLLPDIFNKSKDSNIRKFFRLVAEELAWLKETFRKIDEWRDVDVAWGTTLDLLGGNVDQVRGRLIDEVYRVMIKSKVIRNMSDGTIPTIIRAMAATLSVPEEEVTVIPYWHQDPPEPAALKIHVPLDALAPTMLSWWQFGQLIELIVAAGVRTETFFQGSFQFSSQEAVSEFDADKGFANEEQTTGGRLGAYYDPAWSPDLPL